MHAVMPLPHSIGPAGVDLPFARHACTRMSGACLATTLPGSVLTVETGTDSGISNFNVPFGEWEKTPRL